MKKDNPVFFFHPSSLIPEHGGLGGVEPTTATFTESHASRYNTNPIQETVVPTGLEPVIFSMSRRCPTN
jgi:hypothetical protein